MKNNTLRILVLSIAATVLVSAILVRAYPPVVVLFDPRVTFVSPYCSRWDAMWGAGIKLKQSDTAERILSQSRLLKRDGDLELWATPRGAFWTPSGGGHLLSYPMAEEERNIYGDGPWGVAPGDVVIDCGAFVGTTARQFLRRGARIVVAVEPTPESVECLRRNFAQEIATGRVIVCPKGVWDSEGSLTFHLKNDRDNANSFIAADSDSQVLSIPVTTIDRLVEELQIDRVDYIKMDVEGAERRALVGARKTIERFRPRLALSVYHIDDDPVKIPVLVRQAWRGYRMACGPCLLNQHTVYTDVLLFR